MIRLLAPSLLGLVLVLLWGYCIIDVIATDEGRARNLPKSLWLLVVIFVPTVGSLAWLAVGRPLYAPIWPGTERPAPKRGRSPEDDPNWYDNGRYPVQPPLTDRERRFDLDRRERELREREEELRRREDGTD